MSAARLILVIENMFNVKLSVTDMLKGIKVKHQARDILRALDIKCGRQKPVYLKTGAAALLRKVLDSAKVPTIPSSYASLESKTSSKITPSLELCNQIFLTGASGYFGAHLLYELLTAGVKKVVCLIRKRMGRSNDDVLKENLRKYGLLRRLEPEHLERVETVTGDLTKVGFGVDGLTYENLLLKSDGKYTCRCYL